MLLAKVVHYSCEESVGISLGIPQYSYIPNTPGHVI